MEGFQNMKDFVCCLHLPAPVKGHAGAEIPAVNGRVRFGGGGGAMEGDPT